MAGRPFPKIEIILKKFGNPKIISTFAIPIAEIAQLVEHDLAKRRRRGFESRFPLQKVSNPLTFFHALTFRTILELAAPNYHSFCFYRLKFVHLLCCNVKYGKT